MSGYQAGDAGSRSFVMEILKKIPMNLQPAAII